MIVDNIECWKYQALEAMDRFERDDPKGYCRVSGRTT